MEKAPKYIVLLTLFLVLFRLIPADAVWAGPPAQTVPTAPSGEVRPTQTPTPTPQQASTPTPENFTVQVFETFSRLWFWGCSGGILVVSLLLVIVWRRSAQEQGPGEAAR